jgi:hypothetical protein
MPVAIATQQIVSPKLAIDDKNVYWTTPTGVMGCTKLGCTTPWSVMSWVAPGLGAVGIATDGESVWASDYTNSRIVVCPKMGCPSDPQVVASGQQDAYEVAVDGTNVFWTTQAPPPGSVAMCPKAGCPGPPLSMATVAAQSMALDATHVYWTSGAEIRSCPKTGCVGGMPALVVPTTTSPDGLVVQGGNLYFGSADSSGQISTCPVTGCLSGKTILTSGFQTSYLAVDANNVYFTAAAGMTTAVYSCSKAGCATPRLLAGNQRTAAGIAVDATAVYWVAQGDVGTATGNVMKLALP